MAQVEIYTTGWCPYCARAKSVLQQKGVAFEEISLDGLRVGMTLLSPGVRTALEERGVDVKPVISQFGWQYERQFYSNGGGLTALNEWVLLLGGLLYPLGWDQSDSR